MYEVTFFKSSSDPFQFAVTPDATGSVLPPSDKWERWFSQPVHPEQAMDGSDLKVLEAGFRKDGYFVYPRKKKGA